MFRTHTVVQCNIDDAITPRDLACADESRWSINASAVLFSSGITAAINPDHYRRARAFSVLLEYLLRAVYIKEQAILRGPWVWSWSSTGGIRQCSFRGAQVEWFAGQVGWNKLCRNSCPGGVGLGAYTSHRSIVNDIAVAGDGNRGSESQLTHRRLCIPDIGEVVETSSTLNLCVSVRVLRPGALT
jgi:hypothetical protein